MMKVVINNCFGGFGLSQAAVKRLAELNGRECYFFKSDLKTGTYTPFEGDEGLFWVAFDIPNPNEVLGKDDDWCEMTMAQKVAHNELYQKHDLDNRYVDRADKFLIQVIEELGDKANGQCAKLKIVDIPDGVDYEISEYDGNEHIAEKHRTWD